MKAYVSSLALAVLLSMAPAHAAPQKGLAKIGDAWTFWLRGEELNGQFDSILVDVTAAAGYTFANPSNGLNGFSPRLPGEPATFVNRVLDQDPLDGGLGWSILGRSVTANILTFGGGPLGTYIDTSAGPGGWLFLANLFVAPGDRVPIPGDIQLISAGNIIYTIPTTLDRDFIIPNPLVPEPSAGVLVASAGLAIQGARRRSLASRRIV